MKIFRIVVSNSIFALNILLVFLLIFRDQLDIPTWLQVVGRMHPLLVHLPIGFLVLVAIAVLFKKGFKQKSFQNFLNFILYLGALSAALVANLGLLLSTEGGHNETQLQWHLFTGVSVSLLSWCLLLVGLYGPKNKLPFNILLSLTTLALLLAGHFGSILTHGENFVLQPLEKETNETVVVTDSTSLYAAAIYPVLKGKCMTCHNERKAKGNLIMSSIESIIKGGKHGAIWNAGDPANSTLIKRIYLPEEHDDHMPPAGKPQLAKNEKELLYLWILEGANLRKPWTRFNASDSLRLLAEEFIRRAPTPAGNHYHFPFASKETIEGLNSPYCTVSPLALDEPGIAVDFFLPQGFERKKLEDLLRIKEQLVFLNLAGMPLTVEDSKILGQFNNLEKLNLNKTKVTGEFLSALKGLGHLKSLSLTGTRVDKKALDNLAAWPSLKEVFIWNTKLSPTEITTLQKQFPSITWNAGYPINEVLTLTPPLLVNESFLLSADDRVLLKHNLPGTEIRFTLNGRDPDSLAGSLYHEPVQLPGYTLMKARAYKKGWYGSPVVQFYFFRKGIRPLTAELLNPPNKEYKGEGAATLTDNKKGSPDSYKDIAWLGYREQPLVALFTMKNDIPIKNVTVSYGSNSAAYIFPPSFVELWTGNDITHLKLFERILPQQPDKKEKGISRVEGVVFKGLNSKATYYKIIVQPIARVPIWVSTKQDKGWVMVDEVMFN